MHAFLDVCLPGQSAAFTLSETDMYRLLCHAIVQQLPDVAFQEAVESLTGMYSFYQNSPALLDSPPTPYVKAKITGSYVAPVYPVMED